MISPELIETQLKAKFGEVVSNFVMHYNVLTFDAQKDSNLKVLTFLAEETALGFTWLNDVTAVHYPDRAGQELEVVYLLQNMKAATRLRMKCAMPAAEPKIFTASTLHASANWQEREAYDFFGVDFIGHPNLTRIMNVDEMDYHPLLKHYPLEDQTRTDKDDAMFGRN